MDRCRVCQADGGMETVTARRAEYVTTWIRCPGCGVERVPQYPSRDELAAYYGNHYLDIDCRAGVSHRLRWAPSYRQTVWDEYRMSTSDLGLEPEAMREMEVLDFGCADGIFLDWLLSIGVPPHHLYGVDVSAEMIEMARRKGHQASTTEEGHRAFGKNFDLVTLWDVIEHVPFPADTVVEVRDALKPGGQVLVQTPRAGLLSEQLGERFDHYVPFEHLHLFRRETLVGLFEANGFETVKLASFGANAPAGTVPPPYKQAFDRLAKVTDNGVTQLARFRRTSV